MGVVATEDKDKDKDKFKFTDQGCTRCSSKTWLSSLSSQLNKQPIRQTRLESPVTSSLSTPVALLAKLRSMQRLPPQRRGYLLTRPSNVSSQNSKDLQQRRLPQLSQVTSST